jgi:hypothetical protein
MSSEDHATTGLIMWVAGALVSSAGAYQIASWPAVGLVLGFAMIMRSMARH